MEFSVGDRIRHKNTRYEGIILEFLDDPSDSFIKWAHADFGEYLNYTWGGKTDRWVECYLPYFELVTEKEGDEDE